MAYASSASKGRRPGGTAVASCCGAGPHMRFVDRHRAGMGSLRSRTVSRRGRAGQPASRTRYSPARRGRVIAVGRRVGAFPTRPGAGPLGDRNRRRRHGKGAGRTRDRARETNRTLAGQPRRYHLRPSRVPRCVGRSTAGRWKQCRRHHRRRRTGRVRRTSGVQPASRDRLGVRMEQSGTGMESPCLTFDRTMRKPTLVPYQGSL